MVTRVTSSNTKAQILKAYKEALAEIKSKDGEITKLQRAAKSATAPAPAKAAAPKAAGTPATVSGIVTNLGSLADNFGNAVNALSATLTAEATRLQDLKTDSAAITQELNDLHNIEEINDETFGQLINDLQERIEQFEDEQENKRNAFEEELSTMRASWKTEREENTARIKERDDILRKARKREADEFKYDLSLRRKQEQDAQAQLKKGRDAELAEIKEAAQKANDTQEAQLAEREKAATEAADKAEKLTKELETAIKKARDEGNGIARRQAKVKADLLAKEHEGRQRVYDLKISTKEETIAKQAAQIDSLSKQLNNALKQAQDLAVKAIEGAANVNSFEAIREIAMEQAKTPQKGK